ncbi:sigma 54-interacting transcriptional regulator [Acrocarpospora phusangensis]|uniref:sigma 54-interacting transcriptional regulator n=1 Tax=Acrocarpospora phusangensis TaxID=1070424 RepID=UPI00194DE8B3|nr:sigma 54-interacting transcriptional regulator [Acrocarpospora phusangensis]
MRVLHPRRRLDPVHKSPAPAPSLSTLRELRESGHVHRSVKAEIRENLLARLRAGETRFPGIVGFDESVLPHLERALIAGHDLVLLGERGQGKTRLIRTVVGLLDEWTPVVAGCEINDHPYAPVCARCRGLAEDEITVAWKHRDERYGEKLATPDTSVGDLIGDVDPIKIAEGRTLGDPETVHYGLVPRTNRGVFSVNELPDLAERIQVSLLNVLEERDIQVRGYNLRLPLDLLLIASANPEDYTNRGRIITPLKDRFGAEVRTHYPKSIEDELVLIRQEVIPDIGADVPEHLVEIVARFTRLVRESTAVDTRSGVSARFSIAATETAAASAVRRAALTGEENAVTRVCDLPGIVHTLRGKVEFEVSEEGREVEVLAHLLRRATAETFRNTLGGLELAPLLDKFAEGAQIESGELVPATELLRRIGRVDGLSKIMSRLGMGEGDESPGHAAAALEFALEGLYLMRRLSKDDVAGGAVYRT